MTRNREDYFLSSVDQSEILRIFLEYFSHAHQVSESQEQFHTADNAQVLDVYFKKNGSIERVEDNLSQPQFEELRNKIKSTLIDNTTEKIAQVVCFSSEKIAGCFKYRDLFQIIPIPEEATPAPFAVADHPFILQFKFSATTDFVINNLRRAKYSTHYIKFLNAILKTHVFNSPRYTEQFWSWEIIDEQHTRSKWVQEGYVIDGFGPEVEEFTVGIDPIGLKPADDYFAARPGRSLENMVLPDNLAFLLDKVFALDVDKVKQFEIACTWFAQAQDIWAYSHSAAYVAIISSIEALMDKTEETCKCCGQPKYSLTKKFKSFLESYVPNIDTFPKEKKLIYKTRSELAHGVELLESDLEPWAFMSGSKKMNQDSLQRLTHEIVSTALINWLVAN